jgi:AmmeMemoRadiSam system protein B/AmmeMemoRadiSam system protein A
MLTRIREAAVAGRFYPDDPRVLARDVDRYVAEGVRAKRAEVPKALIVPHAGYVYSGPVAGSAYKALAPARGKITRVVLLGPAHRVAVRGLARVDATELATPIGNVKVDERLDALVPEVPKSAAAHAQEHSLEVQLPFLLRVLGPEITVAPFVVGGASPDEVARVLEALWGGDETVILISSDLSHYLPYDVARDVDAQTADDIVRLSPAIDSERACGARAIDGLARVAAQRGLVAERIDLRTSGDTAGPRDEVVGYGAFAFYAPTGVDTKRTHHASPTHDASKGRMLLALARAAMEEALGVPGATTPSASSDAAWLREDGATFVTLRRSDGDLHGCIGSLEPRRALGLDVRKNARAAAIEDPRAEEISARVAGDLSVEVSVLGPMERIPVSTREELLRALRPNVDGLVLTYRGRRATFLPQVWESLTKPNDFVSELFRKAGLPRDFWAPDVEAYRYHVDKYEEPSRSSGASA